MGTLIVTLLLCILSLCHGIQGLLERTATVPAPIVVSPSQYFEGIGGPWPSFELRVGTLAQNVRFFLGSSSTSTVGSDCVNVKGGIFTPNSSTTWDSINMYGLEFEQNLGYTNSAEFGLEIVGLGYQGSGAPTVNKSVVAGAGTNFWIGLLGLNPRPTNFTSFDEPQASLMTLLRTQSNTKFIAGAPYRLKRALGSLVFGGYDNSRLLRRICPLASLAAFGLIYDHPTGLYPVDDTLHNDLVSRNPTVIFTIGNTVSGGPSTDITLSYASFDLQATYPLVGGNSSRYFSLQRAANETQSTLGRTFLQEACLTVD
ncbi:hypothetical protein BDZ45DRAFT_707718 [Acephala macrosclerotiorum]|nr:hypothetical protein BDZ45DRAFT_707718 [Acephala macrosclerotiorum]